MNKYVEYARRQNDSVCVSRDHRVNPHERELQNRAHLRKVPLIAEQRVALDKAMGDCEVERFVVSAEAVLRFPK